MTYTVSLRILTNCRSFEVATMSFSGPAVFEHFTLHEGQAGLLKEWVFDQLGDIELDEDVTITENRKDIERYLRSVAKNLDWSRPHLNILLEANEGFTGYEEPTLCPICGQ